MTDPAADPLLDLASAGQDAAAAIDSAFAKAAESLTLSLTKAAASGKLSLATLAQAALQAVDALAKVSTGSGSGSGSGGGGQSLGDALAGVIGGAFSGAKADGGPVAPGGAYLVGERGPELFTPASVGDIGSLESRGGRRRADRQPDRAGRERPDRLRPQRSPAGPGPRPRDQPRRALTLDAPFPLEGGRVGVGGAPLAAAEESSLPLRPQSFQP